MNPKYIIVYKINGFYIVRQDYIEENISNKIFNYLSLYLKPFSDLNAYGKLNITDKWKTFLDKIKPAAYWQYPFSTNYPIFDSETYWSTSNTLSYNSLSDLGIIRIMSLEDAMKEINKHEISYADIQLNSKILKIIRES